jgi:hypothetical protein
VRYAVRACPFLLLPKAQRREANLPEGVTVLPGHTARNPAVAMLWLTDSYRLPRAGRCLIQMGLPNAVEGGPRAELRRALRWRPPSDEALPILFSGAAGPPELESRVYRAAPINGTDPTAAWVDE